MDQSTKTNQSPRAPSNHPAPWRCMVCAATLSTLSWAAPSVEAQVVAPKSTTPPAVAPLQQDRSDPIVNLSALDSVSPSCWSEVRTLRVYFAHQSVGSEILTGLAEVHRRYPSVALACCAYAEPDQTDGAAQSAFDTPGIVGATAGKRGYPEQKIDEFSRFLRSSEGAKIDVAMLKLCYGDIGRNTNIDALVERYLKAVAEIQRERPTLRLVHCTVPLKSPEESASRIKRLVGVGTDASNAARARYNAAIRQQFPLAQVFDIAAAQARRTDGTEATVEHKGKRLQVLASEYTDDGASLNRKGQIVLAREMLLALSKQCDGETPTGTGVTSATSTGKTEP